MMKKHTIALFAALLALPLGAFTRPPVVWFKDGDVSGFAGADELNVFHHAQSQKRGYLKAQKVKAVPGALEFNGRDSLCMFRLPWLYPGRPASVTVAVDVTIDDIPPAGCSIAGRSGFDNMLGLRGDGAFTFNCFNRAKQGATAVSKVKAKKGGRYFLAGVVDCSGTGNQAQLRLYVNGDLAATAVLAGADYPYAGEFYAGGSGFNKDNSVRRPFLGKIHAAALFYAPLSRSELCRYAATPSKTKWNAYLPLATYQKPGKLTLKAKSDELTLKMTFTVHKLPKAPVVIAGRPGWHNTLELLPDGRLLWCIWNETHTHRARAYSKTKLRTGSPVSVTATVEKGAVETVITLFVNGKEEGRAAITGLPYPYGTEFWFKGITDYKGGTARPFDGDITSGQLFGIALP